MRFVVTALAVACAAVVFAGCSHDKTLKESPEQIAKEQAAADAHNADTVPFAGDDEMPTSSLPPDTPTTQVSYAGVEESKVGDCLDLPTFADASVRPVPCDTPHHYEVTAKIDLSPRFPRSAAYPDDWNAITVSDCRPAFEAYVRRPPPFAVENGSLHPLSDGWDAGARDLTCVAEPPGNKEGNVLTGSVRKPA
ncbi:MAG: septum formation family protein [Acidimicrobiia bacterium]|nr:septum formation family protein [Acidimicrobiia bacterium]